MITKLDCVVSLAFMSQNKLFMITDIILLIILYFTFVLYKRKVILPYLDVIQDNVEIIKWYERIQILIIVQFVLMFIQFIFLLFSRVPLNTVQTSSITWINIVLFIVVIIFRFVLFALTLNFITMLSIRVQNVVPPKVLWIYFTIFIIPSFLFAYRAVQIVSPGFNHILNVYESFYNIRDIYLDSTTTKSYKDTTTNQILDRLLCYFGGSLPVYTHATVQHQLSLTFKSYPKIIHRKIDCSKIRLNS